MVNNRLFLGSLLLANLLGSQALATEVFNNDVTVSGSQCVGFDCTSAETFGYSTIKLRENNVRITFDDTSSSAAFPNTDWQLTANDSNNGGLNRFSIEDVTNDREILTVVAKAPDYSFYIGENGDAGLGTNQPETALHLVRSNGPTIRLEQSGNGGFDPAVWDITANESGLSIALDGQNLMTVDDAGNVRLTGSLTAGTPASTFPDYVFDPKYRLIPLEELKSFVAEKQHLPDIPSAQEVGANGLNMTEFQVKLLKKVEELTLYTLQQQDEINALRQTLSQQQ